MLLNILNCLLNRQLNRLRSLFMVLGIAAIALFLLVPASLANPVQTGHVRAALIAEPASVQAGKPFTVALYFQIQEGWHMYWQNPGDSGAKTTARWTLPEGLTAGELVYPYPQRLPVPPLLNFGFKDELALLTEIAPQANTAKSLESRPIAIRADVEWLVCKVECIPERAVLETTVPQATTATAIAPDTARRFDRWRQSIPQPSPWAATFATTKDTLKLTLPIPNLPADRLQTVAFFPLQDGVIQNAAPQSFTVDRDGVHIQVARGYLPDFQTLEGVVTIREKLGDRVPGDRITSDMPNFQMQSFQIRASLVLPSQLRPSQDRTTEAPLPLAQVLLFALLGGAILNLMPCVFPILSLKALSIARKSQHSLREVRLQGLVFTAGILVSFAIVSGVLLLLRGLGQQVGWGFQLQSPGFVTLLAYLLFAVGLNLSGVFIVGAGMTGLGQGLAAQRGYVGEFFTGVLATVMATPCTAPFMATAVGVAIAQPTPIAIGILLTVGLGLALPYLILCWFPLLRRWLPQPGVWMETLPQLLAFPMYGATAWLIWVLAQQTGPEGLAAALLGLLLVGFAAWLYQKTHRAPKLWRRVGWMGVLAAIALTLTLTFALEKPQLSDTPAKLSAGIAWEPYSAARVDDIRRQGKSVFVNFTASWCITCLVNERVALSQPEVQAEFRTKGIAVLKADWTRRDAAIAETLSRFGRSGVPLYLLYPASIDREAIVLPQVLTPAIVKESLHLLGASGSSSG